MVRRKRYNNETNEIAGNSGDPITIEGTENGGRGHGTGSRDGVTGRGHGTGDGGRGDGVRESAGINRLGIGNERVLRRRPSQSLWPRTVRRRW